MKLDFLQVIQLKPGATLPAHEPFGYPDGVPGSAFCLRTCQRTLWIFSSTAQHAPVVHPALEVWTGLEAYALLIRIASGLESKLIGETEIFGQFKAAWKTWSGTLMARDPDGLSPSFFPDLFEDVKWMRSEHLQGLGSESYGSLTRKWLRKNGVTTDQPLLLIGAGKLAHSIAPWVAEHPLYLCNRTEASLQAIESEVLKKSKNPRMARIATALELGADSPFGKPAVAIVCTPETEISLPEGCTPLHLGEEMDGLNALFALQEDLNVDFTRRSKIERARRGSHERATLRILTERCGGSHGTSHGWEDLALFA